MDTGKQEVLPKKRVEYCVHHGNNSGRGKPCWHCLRPMDYWDKRECTWVDPVREKMRITVVKLTTDQKIESLIKEVGLQAVIDYLNRKF